MFEHLVERAIATFATNRRTSDFDLAGRLANRAVFEPGGQSASFRFDYKPALVEIGGKVDQLLHMYGWKGGVAEPVIHEHRVHDEFGRETLREYDNPSIAYHKEKLTTAYIPNRNLVALERRQAVVTHFPKESLVNYDYDAFGSVTRTRIWDVPFPTSSNTPITVETKKDTAGNSPYKNYSAAHVGVSRSQEFGDISLSGGDYDAEGNIRKYYKELSKTSDNKIPQEIWTFDYDHRNRMISASYVVKPDVTVGTTVPGSSFTFEYDTFEHLVVRKEGTTVTNRMVYDGAQIYGDLASSGQFELRYLQGSDGEMIARLDAGGPQYYLTDRQGSVLQIVGANGDTVKRIFYKGTDTAEHHEVQSGYVDRFEFAGRSLDRQTHLQLYGSRWLIASAGRFLTESGDGTNLHPYAFAGNNPTNEVKPEGENFFSRMLFSYRDDQDGTRSWIQGLNNSRKNAPDWLKDVGDGAVGPLGTYLGAGDMIADSVIGIAAAVPALKAMAADVAGKLAEGRLDDAHKSYQAGMLGTYTNMLPAQMIKLAEMGLDKSKSGGVNLDWIPGADNMRLASSVIDMLQDRGRSLDAKQFDRGKDFAPLADELVMLPLDMIGVGEALTSLLQRLNDRHALAAKRLRELALGRSGDSDTQNQVFDVLEQWFVLGKS